MHTNAGNLGEVPLRMFTLDCVNCCFVGEFKTKVAGISDYTVRQRAPGIGFSIENFRNGWTSVSWKNTGGI